MTSTTDEQQAVEVGRPRIAPTVALALLEAIRDQDLPGELLADEDVSITLPRRLGLSDVIDNQIRRYREAVKRRQRVSDAEFTDLVRLVVRRPDSEEVFHLVGTRLSGVEGSRTGLRRILPGRVAYALARRTGRRRLRALFGRPVGRFPAERFALEDQDHLFMLSDPGGDACMLVSGLLESVVRHYAPGEPEVGHVACQAHGAPVCRWQVTREAVVDERAPAEPVSVEEGEARSGDSAPEVA